MFDLDLAFGACEIFGCEDVELLSLYFQRRTFVVGSAGQDDLAAQMGQVSHFESLGLSRPNDQVGASRLKANEHRLDQFNRLILRTMLHPLRRDLPSDFFGQTEPDQVEPFDKPVWALRVAGLLDWAMLAGSALR